VTKSYKPDGFKQWMCSLPPLEEKARHQLGWSLLVAEGDPSCHSSSFVWVQAPWLLDAPLSSVLIFTWLPPHMASVSAPLNSHDLVFLGLCLPLPVMRTGVLDLEPIQITQVLFPDPLLQNIVFPNTSTDISFYWGHLLVINH
jgi:hypothetical protein